MIGLDEFAEAFGRGREARVEALMAHAVRAGRYRCLRISINDARVRLTVPASVSDERLRRFLVERDDWLVRHLKDRVGREPLTRLVDGGRFLLRGRMMRIETTTPREGLKLLDHETDAEGAVVRFALPDIPAGEARDRLVAELVRELLQEEFVRLFGERAEAIVRATGLAPKRFAMSNAGSHWGSCNDKGVVRLSWRLACLEPHLFDYVLVHELMHLREMNHSPAFWQWVQAYCPQYPECRKELKRYRISSLA